MALWKLQTSNLLQIGRISSLVANLLLFFILGFTSVGIFSAFTYNALNHTQVINASLFNTAIPVSIILVCFLLKIEKTNIFQISGLIVSVLGILAIITRLDLDILLTLNFNKGDIYMLIAIISWGIYSAFSNDGQEYVKEAMIKKGLVLFLESNQSLEMTASENEDIEAYQAFC